MERPLSFSFVCAVLVYADAASAHKHSTYISLIGSRAVFCCNKLGDACQDTFQTKGKGARGLLSPPLCICLSQAQSLTSPSPRVSCDKI